jgi:hypothetical protein
MKRLKLWICIDLQQQASKGESADGFVITMQMIDEIKEMESVRCGKEVESVRCGKEVDRSLGQSNRHDHAKVDGYPQSLPT